MPKNHSPLGNKGPLTPENFERLLAQLQGYLARIEAKRHRYIGLRPFNNNFRRRGQPFSHLPPEIKAKAEAKFAAYKEKHKLKLASLTGHARLRFIGCLAGCATRWAYGRSKLDGKRGRNMKRHIRRLQSRLGLKEHTPSVKAPGGWVDRDVAMARIAKEHETHGAPAQAEAGSTDMEGV